MFNVFIDVSFFIGDTTVFSECVLRYCVINTPKLIGLGKHV